MATDKTPKGARGQENFRSSFVICWHKITWHTYNAVAYQKSKDGNQNINIGCPTFSAKSKEDAVAKCTAFIANRGKNSVHDLRWDKTAIDFNVQLSKEYWGDGRIYANYSFVEFGSEVYLVLSNNDGYPMHARHKNDPLAVSGITRNKLAELKLAFGRYEAFPMPKEQSMLMGAPSSEQWFEIMHLGEIEEGGRYMIGAPGFTIAQPRRDHAV